MGWQRLFGVAWLQSCSRLVWAARSLFNCVFRVNSNYITGTRARHQVGTKPKSAVRFSPEAERVLLETPIKSGE